MVARRGRSMMFDDDTLRRRQITIMRLHVLTMCGRLGGGTGGSAILRSSQEPHRATGP
jgi:hypothetical protein